MRSSRAGNITLCVLVCVFAFVAGCERGWYDTITQVSTIDAILAGVYDGQLSCGELAEYGDFGIGTFDRLDGEMILLDGHFFQVRADGRVYRPIMQMTTPFAAVVNFKRDYVLRLPDETNFNGVEAFLGETGSDNNAFWAVKIKGHFSRIKTRSVPAQQKPYPSLAEVVKTQPVFEYADISGTIVGFRAPVFAKGLTVPGYHFHFISDDRKCGGHVLEFELEQGIVEVDMCRRFYLIMPDSESDFGDVDFSIDRSEQLQKAER